MEVSSGQDQIRLNLGAGDRRIEGFLSVDLAGEPDIRADVMALTMFENGSVDAIVGIHLIEHLHRWDAPRALAEWFRVLKPGGHLALELPDLLKCCAQVLQGAKPRAGLWGLYGDPNYQNPLMSHRWGWTAAELAGELSLAGFSKVRERPVQFHKPYRDMRIEAWK